MLKRLLTPRGVLYLFQQHPSAQRTRAVTTELKTALESDAFSVSEVKATGTDASFMTCIVANPRTQQ
ncbi:MAG: hypothetical protein ABR583_04475 [Gaiellaceae bacterium]